MKARNGNGKLGGTNAEHDAGPIAGGGAETSAGATIDELGNEQLQVDTGSPTEKEAVGLIASQKFDYQGKGVRTTQRGGDLWFVIADICNIVDIANSRDAVGRLNKKHRGVAKFDTPGGPQELNIINESGLYLLMLTSYKPEAKAFVEWITEEVVPSIRRTGGYTLNGARPLDEQILAGAKSPTPGLGEAILSKRTTMEARAMASMLLTISAFSDMVQQMRELGANPDGYAASKLKTTIASGVDMARQWLESDLRELAEMARAKTEIKH